MRLWMIIVPAVAMGGLNEAYSEWRESPPSAQSEARRQCIAIADDNGFTRMEAVEMCGCALRAATKWKRANDDAEYTLAVHQSLARPCIEEVIAKRDDPPPFGTFTSGPPPPRPAPPESLRRRLEMSESYRPTTAPGEGDPVPTYPEGQHGY